MRGVLSAGWARDDDGFFFVVFGFQTVSYGNYSLKFFRELALVCVGFMKRVSVVFFVLSLSFLFWLFRLFGYFVRLGGFLVLFVRVVCLVVRFFRMEMEIRDLYEHE